MQDQEVKVEIFKVEEEEAITLRNHRNFNNKINIKSKLKILELEEDNSMLKEEGLIEVEIHVYLTFVVGLIIMQMLNQCFHRNNKTNSNYVLTSDTQDDDNLLVTNHIESNNVDQDWYIDNGCNDHWLCSN